MPTVFTDFTVYSLEQWWCILHMWPWWCDKKVQRLEKGFPSN